MQRLAYQTAAPNSLEELQGFADKPDVDVRAILSDPNLEGDPLQFLKVTEAYWTVRTSPSQQLTVPVVKSLKQSAPPPWRLPSLRSGLHW